MPDFLLTLADPQFYAPIDDLDDVGQVYAVTGMPADWHEHRDGAWTYWIPPDDALAEQGWKIHVSARQGREQHTLDTVAAACRDHNVPFKHLAGSQLFAVLHHKHASRAQAGKFCAVYPPTGQAAQVLLDRLSHDLTGEEGPYVLTDRRYGDTGVVFYRYGAFQPRRRLTLEGAWIPLVRDGLGNDVPDRREPYFTLPEGITDPFVAETDAEGDTGALLDGRFDVTQAIRHSNGGGTYRATDTSTGRTVFIKEARAHNGLTWDGHDAVSRLRRENQVLQTLHATDPGLAPEPVSYFREWEHEFLVTEFIPGISLNSWLSINGVLPRTDAPQADRRAYLSRVTSILDELRAALDRLHAAGMRFGDLSFGNVLADGEKIRLIDFETANSLSDPPIPMATFGFTPPAGLADSDPDEYGYSALAAFLLFPLSAPIEADPAGRLDLLHRDLTCAGPLPGPLWDRATRHYRFLPQPEHPNQYDLPTPHDLDTHPTEALGRIADGLAAGLLADARPDGPAWIFPPSPQGLHTNTHCLAHGTAGVLHALHRAGMSIPEAITIRFRDDVLAARDRLAPGLQVGAAGMALTLAELGHLDEARTLLQAARTHPLLSQSAGLGYGQAGVAMAGLRLYLAGRDEHDLQDVTDSADRLLSQGPDTLTAGITDPGLDTGYAGPALFFEHLGRLTQDQRYLDAASTLIGRELDQALPLEDGQLEFRDRGGRRVIAYLTIGSAGVLTALTRIAARTQDPRLLTAIPALLPGCRLHSSVEPGLYSGVGSWVYMFADHAEHAGGPDDHAQAVRIATGITKYLVRQPTGLRALGSLDPRYHADLATGSAGALLAISRAIGRTSDLLTPIHTDPHHLVRVPYKRPVTQPA